MSEKALFAKNPMYSVLSTVLATILSDPLEDDKIEVVRKLGWSGSRLFKHGESVSFHVRV
jgi:hypothetical protein